MCIDSVNFLYIFYYKTVRHCSFCLGNSIGNYAILIDITKLWVTKMAFTINFGTSNFSNFSGMRTRRQKFGIGSLIILLLFGVVFAGVGLFMYNSAKIDPSWTRVSGQVVNVSSSYSNNSTSYTPTVQYQANGQTYKVSSSIGTSSNPAIG